MVTTASTHVLLHNAKILTNSEFALSDATPPILHEYSWMVFDSITGDIIDVGDPGSAPVLDSNSSN